MSNFSKVDFIKEILLLASVFLIFCLADIYLDFLDLMHDAIEHHLGIIIASLVTALILAVRAIMRLKRIATDLNIANEELVKYERKRFNKQKVNALGSLASGLAHEIKNALQPTLGLGQFIREGLSQLENKKYITYMDTVIDSSHHAHKIIDNVLLFASTKEIEFTTMNSMQVIHDTIRFCRDLLPSTVELKLNGIVDNHLDNGEPLNIKCNQTYFYQILFNILKNSSKAIDQHGCIEVTVEQGKMPKKLDIPAVTIKISDDGKGMDKETLERVFDPFFSTKDISEGTGLGLTVVQTLIQEHDGKLEVESELGKGTTITLYFPIVNGND